jgi:hypothetical protein
MSEVDFAVSAPMKPTIYELDAVQLYEEARRDVSVLERLKLPGYYDLRNEVKQQIADRSMPTVLQHDDPTCRDHRIESTINTLSGLLVPGKLDARTSRGLEFMYKVVARKTREILGSVACDPWMDGKVFVAAAAVGHMYKPFAGGITDFGEGHVDAQPSATWHLDSTDIEQCYTGRGLLISHHPNTRNVSELLKREHTYHRVNPDTIVIVDDSRFYTHCVAPSGNAASASVNFSYATGKDGAGILNRWQQATLVGSEKI